ncbi:MAG: hypothetical protein CVU88_03230 [Firmicutes bacterium HGW-Firmicutes-13]|nr:MAG: hypothetical protein CVU88_03230 [Firmicutes bacterium HGW-Firmicutes-13]
MMSTFHIIHIVVGAWLAVVNFTNILTPATLAGNNIVLGIVVALYNAYFLFIKANVDRKQEQS